MRKFCKGMMYIFALIFVSASFNAQAKSISVSHFSATPSGHQWIFTLDLSRKTTYRSFMLAHPRRLVLDIHHARLSRPIKSVQYANSPVSHIRWSQNPERLRIVFDSQQATKIHLNTIDVGGKFKLRILFVGKNNIRESMPESRISARDPMPVSQVSARESVSSSPRTIISSEARPQYRRNVVVVIDPGHGGKDPGAIGRDGTREKNVVLAISKKLCDMINAQPGFTAKLTRASDYYITLRQRLAIARHYHADMFIAIHADKWKNTTAKGASVFALSERGATGEAARWLASRENKSELMGGATLRDKNQVLKSVLMDLSQTATIQSSLQIGDDLIAYLRQITPLHVHHVEQAAFVVLKSPDIPSLLVETGFLSNPREEHQLQSASYQKRMAAAIRNGVILYYHDHPPKDTLLASK